MEIPQTDAIFEQVHAVNAAADASPTTLRLSLDAKATVKVGPFSRGGTSRVPTAAADHDFDPLTQVTPVGLLVPQTSALFLYLVTGPVTSDCLVDVVAGWWASVRSAWPQIDRLVLNLDNGPENHSGRTQFMKRLVEFTAVTGLTVELAYYPPYHSKYNPVERCWAALEQHWNGSLLDTVEAVLGFMRSMTWQGRHPVVQHVRKQYVRGVRLTKGAMQAVEVWLTRKAGLKKWSVEIGAPPPT